MDKVLKNNALSSKGHLSEHSELMEEGSNAPGCARLRRCFNSSFVILAGGAVSGASLAAVTMPLFLGNPICNTNQFAFGSPLSITGCVLIPISLLCCLVSCYLPKSDNSLSSDDANEFEVFDKQGGATEAVGAQFLDREMSFRKDSSDEEPEIDLEHSYDVYPEYTGRKPPPPQ